jgi:hypothetical protein
VKAIYHKDFGPMPEGELEVDQISLLASATQAAKDEADRLGVPHSPWLLPSGLVVVAPSQADLAAVRLDDL